MKHMRLFLSLFLSIILAISSIACTSSAHIVITDKPVYTLTASFRPGSILENAMKNFANPENKTESLFDPKMLKKTFAESDITLTDITLLGIGGLQFTCRVSKHHPLFAKMIQHDRAKKIIRIELTPEIINSALGLMPEESGDFIEMLAAPIFTGEKLSTADYEQTIAAIYGSKLAGELKKSLFTLEIDSPFTIKSESITPIGKITGKKPKQRRIAIPLIELLCTREAITIQLNGK